VFKAHAKSIIAQTLRVPEPQASLLTGILLGDDAGVPKSLQEAFRIAGHIQHTGNQRLDVKPNRT
jgi:predicted membrane metal-binding protein